MFTFIENANRMKKYPSKISYGLLMFVFGTLIWSTVLVISSSNWIGITFSILLMAFIIHLFSTTHYIIEDNFLIIKAGIVVNKKIDIMSIRKISETNNLISSPALSLDRLDIWYNAFDNILVSPKDKSGFLEQLMAINPGIEVVFKKR